MTIKFAPLAVLHSGSAAPSTGLSVSAAGVQLPARLSIPATVNPAVVGELLGRLDMFGPEIVIDSIELRPVGSGSAAGDPAILRASRGDVSWEVTTVAGATTVVPNGTAVTIDRTPTIAGAFIVLVPVSSLVIAGGVLALFGITPPTSFDVSLVLTSRDSFGFSRCRLGAFRNTATDPSNRVLLEGQLLMLSSRGGAGFPLQANVVALDRGLPDPQDNIFAVDAVYAAPSSVGAVWCDAGDVGVSTPEQVRIPTDIAGNNAASYLRYPAAFFRRPNFARAVQYAGDELGTLPGDGITTPSGALTVYTAVGDILSSEWLFQIDGVAFVALIRHDAQGSLRRPIDIWNRVIATRVGQNGQIDIYDPPPMPAPPGAQPILRGVVKRLEFLEHASFLRGFTDVCGCTPGFVPYGQTGNPPAPPPPPG